MKGNYNRVYIKLGCDCNLHCKYCHAEHIDIQFDEKILPVLKAMNLKNITFGGGEPLLYWDIIKRIVLYIGDSVTYNFATNGTLFTQEIVDFCNEHKIKVAISLDGLGSTRDMSKPIPWDLIKQIWSCGTAVTFYKENSNIFASLTSLNDIKKNYMSVKPSIWSSFPNFVHSTRKTGILSDRKLAESYVLQMTAMFKVALDVYKKKNKHGTFFLGRCFNQFVRRKPMNGVSCCRESNILMLANGTICACPYTLDKIGDIFHVDEIDWQKVREKYSRKDCSTCELFDVCGNYCCMDITDNQCYIMREMHKNITQLMKEYDISYEELAYEFSIENVSKREK